MAENRKKLEEVSSSLSPPSRRRKNLALKFIAGKFVGSIFSIPEEGELTIGRSSDSEITIAEEMVSRRHAKLIIEKDGQIYIEDLQSTNGTFLNGEAIQRASLCEGDRILIGTSIMKLVALPEGTGPLRIITGETLRFAVEATEAQRSVTGGRETTFPPYSKTMEGLLSEIPLMDLLQMFSGAKKSGVLNLVWKGGSANIYLKSGMIVYAAYEDLLELPPRKAFFRLLGLAEGSFSFLPYFEPPEASEFLNEPTEYLIMEGLRRFDEQQRIEKELGLPGSTFVFNFPLVQPLKKLKEEEMDIFQMLYRPLPYEMILDMSPIGDLETVQALQHLLLEKYIRKT